MPLGLCDSVCEALVPDGFVLLGPGELVSVGSWKGTGTTTPSNLVLLD